MSILNIYTDGACSGNQNQENTGGWGSILEFGENKKELFGGDTNTSNNKMELMAVIQGFRALKRDGLKVRVFTDSSYVANCFKEKWYVSWRNNGWRNSKKEPVENRELWEELLSLVEKHQVLFFRVKGHVNPDSPNTNMGTHYEKFREMNGPGFTYEDFVYITRMNNRADELANKGIDQVKERL